MSGREDTKLGRLIVNYLAVVYHSNQMVHYSNIAAVCTHLSVPLALFVSVPYTTARPLRPLAHRTRPNPAESRLAISTITLTRSDQPFPLATLVGYLVYAL